MKKNKTEGAGIRIATGVVALLVAVLLLTATGNLSAGQISTGRESLESSIRRSAIACYAAEGVYPPDIEYLENHYGLQVDRERYIVRYEIFAENIMPEITVLERAG